MVRVLICGLSGAGKSTVIAALSARGLHAVDLDSPDYSHWVEAPSAAADVRDGRDWVWREDAVRDLLAQHAHGILFAAGTASNMAAMLGSFDHVVLLSAPAEVLDQRLRGRAGGTYGSRPADRARVVEQISTVEPLLRRVAGHEIRTTEALESTIAKLIAVATG